MSDKMFGVEPQERWTKEDAQEWKQYSSERLRGCVASAVRAFFIFVVAVLCLLPFTAGYPMNRYWPVAKVLVYVAMGTFFWFFFKCLQIWNSWASSREVEREYGEPE